MTFDSCELAGYPLPALSAGSLNMSKFTAPIARLAFRDFSAPEPPPPTKGRKIQATCVVTGKSSHTDKAPDPPDGRWLHFQR